MPLFKTSENSLLVKLFPPTPKSLAHFSKSWKGKGRGKSSRENEEKGYKEEVLRHWVSSENKEETFVGNTKIAGEMTHAVHNLVGQSDGEAHL